MLPETIELSGKTYSTKELHAEWVNYAEEAEKDKKQFEAQVKINRKFAAGKQHLDVHPRDGRVVDVRTRNGVKMVTADILTPYIDTAVGQLAQNDYRPNFLVSQEYETADIITRQINDAFAFGWDNEWMGDWSMLKLFRLLAVDGTAAIRVRYDRRFGDEIGDFPFLEGRPVTDPKEAEANAGRLNWRKIRQGKIVYEVLDFGNILPPPGVDDPHNFPRDLIVKAVKVADVKDFYGDAAEGLMPDDTLESSGSITSGLGYSSEEKVPLKDMVLVYSGYYHPDSKHSNGLSLVFTKTHLLSVRDRLPLADHPRGARSGVHYFRWGTMPGRFWGKAFIEPGLGPQIIHNKRITQIDTIIDRNMPKVYAEEHSVARPKTGEPMEIIEVRPGSPLPQTNAGVPPGQWMLSDVKMQQDLVERTMGMRSVTAGAPPQGVSAYSALALLTENDLKKLEPVSQAISLEMVEVGWDTMEQMRNWPKEKNIMIAGPEGQLRSFIFKSNQIPPVYLVRRTRGGSLPRSQAAELQKVNDIWTASGGKLPLSWYANSLAAGTPQDLPPELTDVSRHKALLENALMNITGENPPVSPQDDHVVHAREHLIAQQEAESRVAAGDTSAANLVVTIKQHRQEHLDVAQGNASSGPACRPSARPNRYSC
jgi:hypothetical protein